MYKKFILSLIFLCLIFIFIPKYVYSGIIFEDNFDSHADWSPSQLYNSSVECPPPCNSAPQGYDGYRLQGSPHANVGNNTMNINNANFRGSSGKAFTYWSEVIDTGSWASDGLLNIKLPDPSGYPELYVRHYIRFQPDWQWERGQSPMQKFLHVSHWDGTGNVYGFFSNGPNKPLYISDLAKWSGGSDPIDLMANYFYEGTVNEFGYGNNTDNFFPGSPNWNENGAPGDGNWHSFEYYFKINSSPGVPDGQHKFWYDGTLMTNRTNIAWTTSNGQTSPRKNWNYVFIGGNNYNRYTSMSPSAEQWYAIDDLVISTTYVGPDYVIGGGPPPADNTPPTISNGSPSGILTSGTTSVNLSLTTNESAICRYSTNPGVGYSSMTNTFSTTGGKSHSTSITGLQDGQTYNYYIRCQDSAGNTNSNDYLISFSVALPDNQAPSIPTNLISQAVSSSQINLSWSASTDAVGVTGYRLERCQGSSCTNFTQIATPSGISYSDMVLSANTTYRYRVRATDSVGNTSGYSSIANVMTQSADTTPPDGLISHWKFDEGIGITAGDSSGSRNTGTLVNGPQWTNGKIVGALSFDGVNDYVEVSDNSTLDLTDELTLEAWVYPKAITSWDYIITKPNSILSYPYVKYALGFYSNTNTLRFVISIGGIQYQVFTQTLSLNKWHHVVGTYSDFNNEVKIYLNGILEDTTITTGLIDTNNMNLRIGGYEHEIEESWSGYIDEVSIYNYALSQTEVTANYNAGSSLTPLPILGDLNQDGSVNSMDWSMMNSVWGTADPNADLNGDGVVNTIDWSIMSGEWTG